MLDDSSAASALGPKPEDAQLSEGMLISVGYAQQPLKDCLGFFLPEILQVWEISEALSASPLMLPSVLPLPPSTDVLRRDTWDLGKLFHFCILLTPHLFFNCQISVNS